MQGSRANFAALAFGETTFLAIADANPGRQIACAKMFALSREEPTCHDDPTMHVPFHGSEDLEETAVFRSQAFAAKKSLPSGIYYTSITWR